MTRVEDARHHSPPDRIAPLRLPARDEVEALVQLCEQAWDLARVVLEVAVDRDDDLALGVREPGGEGGRLAEVAAQAHDLRVRRPRVEPGQRGERAVLRAVVDEDRFPGLSARLQRGVQLVVEEGDASLLVVYGDDDRNHGSEPSRVNYGGGGGGGGGGWVAVAVAAEAVAVAAVGVAVAAVAAVAAVVEVAEAVVEAGAVVVVVERWRWRRRRRRRRAVVVDDRRAGCRGWRRRVRAVVGRNEGERDPGQDEQRQADQCGKQPGSSVRPRRRDDLRGRVPGDWNDRSREQPDERTPVRGPIRGRLGQRLLGHCSQRHRRIRPKRVDRGRRLVELAAQQVDGARRLEGEPPREQPEQDHAERIDVARGGGAFSRSLLRRHVRGRSDQRAGLRQRVHAGHPGNAEVRDLGATLLVEEDVRRLQVAVDEPVLVRVREPGSDLGRDRPGLGVRERPAVAEALLERAARQVLEDHERPPALASVVVEAADVRVRQRSDGPRLALEAQRIRVSAQELERDRPAELRVDREPDLGHRPRSQLLFKPIAVGEDLAHAGVAYGCLGRDSESDFD